MEIFETKVPVSSNSENIRITSLISRLKQHGISIERYNQQTSPKKFQEIDTVGILIAAHGEQILPITLVNGFAMITGRYPSNEEIRQILTVPADLIAEKNEGCCCIQGCVQGEKTS
ncbi:arsenic metallochaperone ArsD family protein [Methanocorpusculum sp. MG]|uniref:Arsenic metallochaperone ArsD family protein n=1 Tax=Methanocorpusculum petauri TaxID=3002863 RepID=A0ABT4IJY8_9EURY|nr:arsenic metallochaperone ArsD family protein [Methanocorpusculum petauri]MCZ0861408.1 arsenic metallochaperone ArsD family protein [Methanocorpusculum petauri]MCZ9312466.1 arsenic metallochaperone ArsD family protein [Methanocorpusculum sp.]